MACSICGQEGHNRSTCARRQAEAAERRAAEHAAVERERIRAGYYTPEAIEARAAARREATKKTLTIIGLGCVGVPALLLLLTFVYAFISGVVEGLSEEDTDAARRPRVGVDGGAK